MGKAGYCSQCGANVWLDASGGCPKGHGADSISNVYDTDAPVAPVATPVAATPVAATPVAATPVPATPVPATPVPATPAPAAPPRKSKGKTIAILAIVGVLVIAGLVIGGVLLFGGFSSGDPLLEAAADYESALFRAEWDEAAEYCSETLGDNIERVRENFEEIIPPDGRRGIEVSRTYEDDILVMELKYETDDNMDETILRFRYERVAPDSNQVLVLVDNERPGKDPRRVGGYFAEMYKEGGDWKIMLIRQFTPDELQEYIVNQ